MGSQEIIGLTSGSACIPGNPNIGLLISSNTALLVDAGGDRDRGKAVLKAVRAAGLEVCGILLTHSHADHIGGADYLHRETGAPVICPALEKCFVEHTVYEPTMLISGAAPWKEMLGKFLKAPEVPVEGCFVEGSMSISGLEFSLHSLPGHSMDSVGIGYDGVLFAGDSVFDPRVLEKFAVPYNVDIAKLLDSYAAIESLTYSTIVPGHGEVGGRDMAAMNRDIIIATLDRVLSAVETGGASGIDAASIIADIASRAASSITNPAMYFLYHTGVMACLSYLYTAGSVRTRFEGNRMLWVA